MTDSTEGPTPETFVLMGKYACGFTNDGRHCLGCGGSMELCGTPKSQCPHGDPNERQKVTELLAALAAVRARADAAIAERDRFRAYFGGAMRDDGLIDLKPFVLAERLDAAEARAESPIDMVLYCPKCDVQHIDAPDERTPDWKNPSHKSHLCHGCGHIWRPSDHPTNGVASLPSGKDAATTPNHAALSRALEEAQRDAGRLAEALEKVANWRQGCHAFDADMGNNPRSFNNEEEWETLEAHATDSLAARRQDG